MPRELHSTRPAASIDARNSGSDMSGKETFEDDRDWSLPWPSRGPQADDAPSRPPKVWEAEPNLGRIWPVQTRSGGFTLH